MSAGPSLYRRHRPRTFADVVGQEHVVRTLRNAVAQDKVHHAYLFVGSRGTGKTSMAKILAACLNCRADGGPAPGRPTVEPCGRCDSCVAIASATSLDVIEMDAASNNSVDDIRELRESVQFAPVSGRSKVYILDEAHMLSSQAWNAFLKTLEEPPPDTIFVLATTEAQKVPPTVVDRCHRFDFGRPTVEQLAAVVGRVAAAEGIEIAPDAVALVARQATGSFRDALGTLEQLVTYTGTAIAVEDVLAVLGVADADLVFGTVDAVAAHDAAGALRAVAAVAASGHDLTQFARDVEAHARDLLVVQTLGELPSELKVTPERDARLADQAARVPRGDVVRLLDLLAAALRALKDGASARTQVELAVVKAAAPELDPAARALAARLERVEAALTGGSAAPAAAAYAAPEDHAPAQRAPRDDAPAQEEPPPTPNGAPAEHSAEAAEPSPDPPEPSAHIAIAVADATAQQPSLDQLVSLWPAVLAAIRGDNHLLEACLAEARPVELRGRELVVAFSDGQQGAFNRKMAERNRGALEAALRDLAGAPLRPTFELREPEEAPPARPPSEQELLARLVTEFDAEEIVSEPEPHPEPAPDPSDRPTPSEEGQS